ncbi:hypothetical protein SAMN05443634_106209 [Chishuiella changwenlii]|uniref:Uncharacterized protein n=2 Tax=Chishuiella changwenlii TaxID=1434701 RepID=A0A1M6YDT1_9FLAO|nr:hypothetical protein SAMN05443634_106209 [Chishuiella changwenlii]
MKSITFKKFVCSIFFISSFISAQVGINTAVPNATLDVVSSPTDVAKIDGFIPPKLTGDELKAKDNLYTTNQIGAIVYITVPSIVTTPKTVRVTSVGYYFYDGVEWEKINSDTTDLSGAALIAGIYGFAPASTGNTTTYLGANMGANIRKVRWDAVRKQVTDIITYNATDNSFTANRTGYFQFAANLVFRGPYNDFVRLGFSRAYTGTLSTASNATFSFFTQPNFNADANAPVTLYSSGVIRLVAGQKISTITRFITPTTNTLDVEDINYDRTLISSLVVTFYSED